MHVSAGTGARTARRRLTSMWLPLLPMNCLYWTAKMMRIATSLIAMLSVLSAPIASAVCAECCQRPIEHHVTLCHNKAHAQPGPHMRHMNRMQMVTQESDSHAIIQPCDHQLLDRRLRCHIAACLWAGPIQTSIASVPAHHLPIASPLIATPICSALTIPGAVRPPGASGIASTSSQPASAPLRI